MYKVLSHMELWEGWMHTSAVVELSAGELIDCYDFALAVARFRYPVPEKGATGIACITNSKMVDYSFRARPVVFTSESQCEDQQAAFDFPIERLVPKPSGDQTPLLIGEVQLTLPILGMMSELSWPVALTEKDWSFLKALLDKLPDGLQLKYPLSEWDQGRFLAIFREELSGLQLVGEPCWEPILVTERHVELQRSRQWGFFEDNGMIAIGEEFSMGLDVLDRVGRSVETFDARLGRGHYFLLRQQAIKMLQDLQFPFCDSSVDSQPPSDIKAAQEGGEPRKKWSKELAEKMHREYLQDNDLVENVAKRYDISSPRLYQIFAEYGLPVKSRSGRKAGEKPHLLRHTRSQPPGLQAVVHGWPSKVDMQQKNKG
jgi:hypothetical protein